MLGCSHSTRKGLGPQSLTLAPLEDWLDSCLGAALHDPEACAVVSCNKGLALKEVSSNSGGSVQGARVQREMRPPCLEVRPSLGGVI